MNDSINPAWKPILDALPQEFHSTITPILKEWDKGVQTKFQEIHSTYEDLKPYKALVDNNIDPNFALQAASLANKLKEDPEDFINQVNDAWELGFVSKDEAEKLGQTSAGTSTETDDDSLFGDDDITKHPKFLAMQQALEQVQNTIKSQEEKDAEQQALEEFNAELDELEKKYTQPEDGNPQPFHRTFVTALMAQGLDGDEAVKQYHQILAGNSVPNNETSTDTDQPPVVMGNGGSIGSGQSDNPVDFGSLGTSELNDSVAKLLAAQFESGQG